MGAPAFERLPACEFLLQLRFDLLHAPPIAAQLLGCAAVVVRQTHARGNFRLLALERFDGLRQSRKFPLIFVAELGATLGARRRGLWRGCGRGCGRIW